MHDDDKMNFRMQLTLSKASNDFCSSWKNHRSYQKTYSV